MNDKIKYWLELSDYDIETASAMLITKRYLYVGFMCHQSVEKCIKAVMSAKNEDIPPKIHNLIRLAELSGLFDKMSDEQKQTLFVLNPLNIESRYPSYKEMLFSQLTKEKCEAIIKSTGELLLWIKAQL